MVQIVDDEPVALALDNGADVGIPARRWSNSSRGARARRDRAAMPCPREADSESMTKIFASGYFSRRSSRRDAGGLIRCGQRARKADAEDVLALLQDLFHRVGELADVDRGGRAVRARGDLGEKFLGRHVRVVGRIQKRFALDGK